MYESVQRHRANCGLATVIWPQLVYLITLGAPSGRRDRMTRRTCLNAVTGAVVMAPLVFGGDISKMRELLEASQNEKKGVTVYLKGQSLGGVVTKINGDFVEMRNRNFGRSVVRMAAIDGAAMNKRRRHGTQRTPQDQRTAGHHLSRTGEGDRRDLRKGVSVRGGLGESGRRSARSELH